MSAPADDTKAVARKVADDLHDMQGVLDQTLWGLANVFACGECGPP